MEQKGIMERKGICKNVAACSLAKGKVIQEAQGLPGMSKCPECGKFLKEIDEKKPGKKGKWKVIIIIIAIITVIALLCGGAYAYLLYGNPPILSVSFIQKDDIHVLEGETKELNVKVVPFSANSTMRWASNNESIATVDSMGIVTGVQTGTAVITATSVNDDRKTASCKVFVEENIVGTTSGTLVQSVSFEEDSLVMKPGEWDNITVKINPADADQRLLWQPADDSIVTVSAGTIIALQEGSTIITVTTADGSNLVDTCWVTVVKGTPDTEKIVLDLEYGVYAGKVKDGKPDGKGRMIYKQRTLISEDDRQQRYAEPGQVVDGIWYDGRLDTGELIDISGVKISSLSIGRRP